MPERAETLQSDRRALFGGAAGIFFSGGDPLRVTRQIGNTPIEARVRELYARGGVVAGPSAGASGMSETLLVRGSGGESSRIGDLHMAPGLGPIRDVTIDQHFGERGRIGRPLGVVAHNPRARDRHRRGHRRGGARRPGRPALPGDRHRSHVLQYHRGALRADSVDHGVRLHVLSRGDTSDLGTRRPGHMADVEDSQARESPLAQT